MVSVELFQSMIRLKIIFNKKIFALLNFVYYIINMFHVNDISKIDGDSMPFVLLVVGFHRYFWYNWLVSFERPNL